MLSVARTRRISRCYLTPHISKALSTQQVDSKLVKIASDGGNWLYSWSISDAFSTIATRNLCLEQLVHGLRFYNSRYLWKALAGPTSTDSFLVCRLMSRAVASKNLELALQHLHTLRTRGLPPNPDAVNRLVLLCAFYNQPRLANDIAKWFEATYPVHKFDRSIWLECAAASSFARYDKTPEKVGGGCILA
ncbi:hypothetical protein FA15DRAFT_674904 [Coprinopsis marcescibilis]|uniref:Uncharacterized protein n=1 Tax=Coprinopsis marcescibilis TaxID=230819 RepID=A0A5C3KFK7_COPMA|nr:hypothetical protein FA15DRAFT_674904 [Coprinopsis marcescibilis]